MTQPIIFIHRDDIKSLQGDPTLELTKEKFISTLEQLEYGQTYFLTFETNTSKVAGSMFLEQSNEGEIRCEPSYDVV